MDLNTKSLVLQVTCVYLTNNYQLNSYLLLARRTVRHYYNSHLLSDWSHGIHTRPHVLPCIPPLSTSVHSRKIRHRWQNLISPDDLCSCIASKCSLVGGHSAGDRWAHTGVQLQDSCSHQLATSPWEQHEEDLRGRGQWINGKSLARVNN